MVQTDARRQAPARGNEPASSDAGEDPLSRSLTHHPVLIVVEGRHDAAFLRRISFLLHTTDARLPDLSRLECQGAILFLFSGGDPKAWARRLAPLGKREFHLIDAEQPPETLQRHAAAAIVNRRPGCRAFVTGKRSIENYLHPDAVRETRGIAVDFGDDDSVPELAARRLFETSHPHIPWAGLPHRVRRRLRDRAKLWLNREAVERMTVERLRSRDPGGEVVSWLATIAELVQTPL